MKTGTIDGLFLEALERFPNRPFLRHLTAQHDLRTTYQEASLRLARTVEQLREFGYQPGDKVVCYLDEMVPALYFMLACTHLHVVPVPLTPTFSIDYLKLLIDRVHARGVFSTHEHAERLVAAGVRPMCFRDGSLPDGVDVLDTSSTMSPEKAHSILVEASKSHRPEDVLNILPTSGSTGIPKLVMRPHRSWVRAAVYQSFGTESTEEPQQRLLLVASLTHAVGFSTVSTAINLAAEICVPTGIDTAADLREVRQLDPTILIMVPRVLRSFYRQHLQLDKDNPAGRIFGPSARYIPLVGAPCEGDLIRYVHKQGVHVVEYYGTSESSMIAMTPVGEWREFHAGKVLPDVEMSVADDGELLARSPGRMIAYYGDEKATRETFTPEGLYCTGDFGEISPDGWVRILGRKRDIFNTPEGSNIYPGRIEDMIESMTWVRQAVLVGDQKPFLSALIVVADPDVTSTEPDGYLPEQEHRALYQRAMTDLEHINAKLEEIEKIRRVALFKVPFHKDLYVPVAAGKIRRNRPGINNVYGARVTALYPPPPPKPAT